MPVNEGLLKRVVRRIGAQRARWDQKSWARVLDDVPEDQLEVMVVTDPDEGPDAVHTYLAITPGTTLCGTKFCFAGHTVLEAGDKILLEHGAREADMCVDSEGRTHVIEERAQALLGLDHDQAYTLFDGTAGEGNWHAYKGLIEEQTGVTLD
jgi:hypothetical protein